MQLKAPGHYQVFDAGKTRRFKPRAIARNVGTKKEAIATAKRFHETHPDRYVGVFTLNRVRIYKPKRRRIK